MTRTCIVCGTTFTMRDNEKPSIFQKRTCCSRKCAGKRNRKPPQALPTRHCEHCGSALARRASERPNKFLLRKYCDRACSEASRAYNPTRTRGTRKRNDRGITFSKNDHAPMSIADLGKPREYPRVQPLGEPCPVHPSNTIGAFGCPACNAGQRWATRQRQTVMRPHHEGGR